MDLLVAEGLRKSYVVAERAPGAVGALVGLVRRRRRRVDALAELSLRLGEGEILALIGPNGAGKSTALKILCGILVPDAGRCECLGLVPWRDRVAHVRRLGAVFGQRSQLWFDLPVADSFDLLRRMYGTAAGEHAARLAPLAERLGIGGVLRTPVRQLSLGQRMRCEIAAALLHRPRLLVLDEPTIGLDADAKAAVRAIVAGLAREGVAVLITTHDLADVAALCRRALVVNRGRAVFSGAIADLRDRVAPERRVTVELGGEPPLPDGVRFVARDGDRWRLALDPRLVAIDAYIARLVAGGGVRDLLVEEAPIEELIARLYATEAA